MNFLLSLLALLLLSSTICIAVPVPLPPAQADSDALFVPADHVERLYAVPRMKVLSLDEKLGEWTNAWEHRQPHSRRHLEGIVRREVEAETSEEACAKIFNETSAEEHAYLKPHKMFPDEIRVEFSSAGRNYIIDAKLLTNFYSDKMLSTAKSVVDGKTYFEVAVPTLRSYHGVTNFGHRCSITLHDEEGSMHLTILEDEVVILDPLERHLHGLQTERRRMLETACDSSMNVPLVLFFERHTQEAFAGAIHHNGSDERIVTLPIGRRSTLRRNLSLDPETVPTTHHDGDRRRAIESWTPGCWTGDSAVYKSISIGIAVDHGFTSRYGSTNNVRVVLAEYMADTNLMYYNQMKVYILMGTQDIRTTADSDTWNQKPANIVQINQCPLAISPALSSFSAWRQNKPNDDPMGLWHLLTNCYPVFPGQGNTVGLAYVGVTCRLDLNTGISSVSPVTFQTLAHEIGHNFNAQHTFNVGGIMDYGDGKYLGEYQFHPNNKASVCAHIELALSRTSPNFVPSCWKNYSPTCGNGVVEQGEVCDNNSPCCSNCGLAAGAQCSEPGACCSSSCKFLPLTTSCGLVDSYKTGHCSKGVCRSSACNARVNTAFCGWSSTNPCLERCTLNGGECRDANTISGLVDLAFAPIGSVCADNPTTTCQGSPTTSCQNSTASPITYSWSFGDWGQCSVPCGTGTRSRVVYCVSSVGATAANNLCSGSAPISSQSCSLPPCNWQTDAFSTCQGTCGTGFQTRLVTCRASSAQVLESYCTASKPVEFQSCALNACVGNSWQYTMWSACSVPCGSGTQTRTVQCKSIDGTVLADSECAGAKPTASQLCSSSPCTWLAGVYTYCSCAAPTQTRTVRCQNPLGAIVPDQYCTSPKPDTSRSCPDCRSSSDGSSSSAAAAGAAISVILILILLVLAVLFMKHRRAGGTIKNFSPIAVLRNKNRAGSSNAKSSQSKSNLLASTESQTSPITRNELASTPSRAAPSVSNTKPTTSPARPPAAPAGKPARPAPSTSKPTTSLNKPAATKPPPPVAAANKQAATSKPATPSNKPGAASHAIFKALYNYTPNAKDELEICEGDTLHVTSKSEDDWYRGKNIRTNKVGVFPGNYVERTDNSGFKIPSSTVSQPASSSASSSAAPKPPGVARSLDVAKKPYANAASAGTISETKKAMPTSKPPGPMPPSKPSAPRPPAQSAKPNFGGTTSPVAKPPLNPLPKYGRK